MTVPISAGVMRPPPRSSSRLPAREVLSGGVLALPISLPGLASLTSVSVLLVAKRDRAYFILMGGCIVTVVLAWTVVRLFSVTAAIAISVAVGLVPPIAAIVANAGDEGSRRR